MPTRYDEIVRTQKKTLQPVREQVQSLDIHDELADRGVNSA